MRRADGLFAMDNDERYVSPYLLRPLRTLKEVLGGRGTAAETARGGVEVTATGGDQFEAAWRIIDLPDSMQPIEHPLHPVVP
jgi:hypothetical protein